jgi:phospholipid/cholesterol/gamma-HCH transport system permease protein
MVTEIRLGVAKAFFVLGDNAAFGFRSLVSSVRRPFHLEETLRQIYEVGYRSVPLIAAAGFAVGAVLSMHTRATLERFGAESMIPTGLGLALVKDTGPLVAALLFAGRVGAGIGAELGAMRVTEQIDALESLAIDSFKHLVVTRVLACMFVLPLLTTIMNFTGIFGGWVAEYAITGIPLGVYYERAFLLIGFSDFVPATLKTAIFGFIISAIACYQGYFTSGGTAGVGQAATRSVVFSSIIVILSNVVLVKAIFFFLPEAAG